MDRITRSLLESFVKEESLTTIDEAESFEHFSNFTVISSEYSEQFDVNDVHAGSGNDTGLDGVAILVNGTLITDIQEIDDLISTNRYLDATFIFVQSKTSSNFDVAEFGNFAFGVIDFFSDRTYAVGSKVMVGFCRYSRMASRMRTALAA